MAGKVALVTGAGSGIGAAVARRLDESGVACVVCADVDEPAAEKVASSLVNGLAVALDVTDPQAVESAIADVERAWHAVDIVVHAAGVDDPEAKQWIAEAIAAGESPQVTTRLDVEAWRRVLAVNLDGTFHVLRAALRVMIPKGSGTVVLVGSSSAFDTPVGYPHYSASKAGVHALAQAVAKEAIPFGVRVNVVAPGPTETGMAERTPDALRQAMTGAGVRAYATPEEIANVALFLAGAESSNVAGAVLLANGGRFTA